MNVRIWAKPATAVAEMPQSITVDTNEKTTFVAPQFVVKAAQIPVRIVSVSGNSISAIPGALITYSSAATPAGVAAAFGG